MGHYTPALWQEKGLIRPTNQESQSGNKSGHRDRHPPRRTAIISRLDNGSLITAKTGAE
ncbi:hypothetical protein [Aliamphritea spongicola]|nr:hypothetical protein [Aliamphritea spongicola]